LPQYAAWLAGILLLWQLVQNVHATPSNGKIKFKNQICIRNRLVFDLCINVLSEEGYW